MSPPRRHPVAQTQPVLPIWQGSATPAWTPSPFAMPTHAAKTSKRQAEALATQRRHMTHAIHRQNHNASHTDAQTMHQAHTAARPHAKALAIPLANASNGSLAAIPPQAKVAQPAPKTSAPAPLGSLSAIYPIASKTATTVEKNSTSQALQFPLNYQPIATQSPSRIGAARFLCLELPDLAPLRDATKAVQIALKEKVAFLENTTLGSTTKLCAGLLGMATLISAGLFTGIYTHSLINPQASEAAMVANAVPLSNGLTINEFQKKNEEASAKENKKAAEAALNSLAAVLNEDVASTTPGKPSAKVQETRNLLACGSKAKPKPPQAPQRASRGFERPLGTGVISSPFGYRHGRMHQGIDYAAPIGTTIKAAAAGRVVHSGWQSGYGKLIVIQHPNGFRTKYAHCQNLYVRTGQRVYQGQRIAAVGNTGRSTGPHLHFELLANGVAINPNRYVTQGVMLANAK